MLIEALLAIHIAVLGYWLGSEFVINSEYRYVCRTPSLPFAERNKLMEHVLDVDQHVRYALVLQAVLGTILAALIGYIPGGGIYPAALGDYLAAVTNRFAGIFYAAPGAVRLENMLLRWMADMVG